MPPMGVDESEEVELAEGGNADDVV
jgi:hypothetical protein